MRGYWAEIDEDGVVIYAEKYLATQKQNLFQQLKKIRENYRKTYDNSKGRGGKSGISNTNIL